MTKKNNDDDVIFIQALATVLRDNDLTELQVERQDGDDRSLNIHLSRAVHVPPAAVVAPVTAPVATPAAPAAAAPRRTPQRYLRHQPIARHVRSAVGRAAAPASR